MAGDPTQNMSDRELQDRYDRVRDIQHEIRNIVMGLTGHVGLLHQNAHELPATARERVNLIRAESTRLQDKLNEWLLQLE